MSFDPFPEHIDPQKLFARNGTLNGCITIGRLPRLASTLGAAEENEGVLVEANLSFSRDDNNLPLLSGWVKAEVNVQCQRCLGTMPLNLKAAVRVVLVRNEEVAERLGDEVEWLHLNIEDLNVLAVLEDELILSLPIVTYHNDENCNNELSKLRRTAEKRLSSERQSPFASLGALKKEFKDKLDQ